MITEQKFKWAMAGLIVMVLLNAFTLTFIWINKPDSGDWRNSFDNNRGAIHKHMQQELGLSAEQAKAIQGLRREHFREMRNLRQSLDQQRREYFDFIMSGGSVDEAKSDSLLKVLTQKFSETERSMYQHMNEVKSLLDKDQQYKFQQMMQQSFSRERAQNRRMRDQ